MINNVYNFSKAFRCINFSLIYFVIIVNILPYFKILPFYNLLWLLPIIIWSALILFIKPQFYTYITRQRFFTIFFIIYTVFVSYLSGNLTIGNRFLSLMQIPFFYWAYEFNYQHFSLKYNLRLILYSLPFVIITAITTLKGLIESPYLSRSIKSQGEETALLWAKGIGGYDFIYFLAFFVIILIITFSSRKTLKLSFIQSLFLLALTSLLFVVVIRANYFTALMMILTSATLFYLFRKLEFIKIILFLPVITFLLIFKNIILTNLIEFLLLFIPQGLTYERLDSLRHVFMFGNNTEVLNSRDKVLESSFNGFIDSPIFGQISNNLSLDTFSSGFGQHSQFLDTFALFGLFLGIIQVYFITQPFIIRFQNNLILKSFSLSILFSVIIVFSFNNVTPSIGYAIFFIFPTFYQLLLTKLNLK